MKNRLTSAKNLRKYRLAATDGEIGQVSDIYFDSQDWTVRYLVVNTGSWLLGKEVLIPAKLLGPINVEDESIHLNLTLEDVRRSPDVDTAKPVSRQDDIATHNHYGNQNPPPVSVGVTFAVSPLMPAADNSWRPQEPDSSAERGDLHLRSAHNVIGHTLHATDDEYGRVGDFLVDDSDWSIRFFTVDTKMWLGKTVVVPTPLIREVNWNGRSVYLTIPRERVEHAPEYDADAPDGGVLQQRLADYYDLEKQAPKG